METTRRVINDIMHNHDNKIHQ
uniref:Uncharacterized protein n=1 Tax=Amphimedon queenslandica TaxID=400682 RepID=A0A1X7UYW7_AMPQE